MNLLQKLSLLNQIPSLAVSVQARAMNTHESGILRIDDRINGINLFCEGKVYIGETFSLRIDEFSVSFDMDCVYFFYRDGGHIETGNPIDAEFIEQLEDEVGEILKANN